ncbi:hypothetical protein C6Q13_33730 [Burkholderia gladioli]|nr:hypothetical protein CO712_02085 [Burkholderia gladioli pv. gladioli]KKJ03015.1 hypothetical protein XF14_31305 [Burkholderia gladioli]PRE78265.1 hypothetical protein C6Q13_33730 [Burkholderia gladioli]
MATDIDTGSAVPAEGDSGRRAAGQQSAAAVGGAVTSIRCRVLGADRHRMILDPMLLSACLVALSADCTSAAGSQVRTMPPGIWTPARDS